LKYLKAILKYIFVSVLVVLMLLGSIMGYLYYNREKIEHSIVASLNEYLNTPVNVGKIDLDFFEKFPFVSLKFKNIEVKGSKTVEQTTLMVANELLLTFNVWDMINQNYEIHKLYLNDAYLTLLVDSNGTINYDIIKKTEKPIQPQTEATYFNLKSINFNNLDVQYINQYKKQEYHFVFPEFTGSFKTENDLLEVTLLADARLRTIKNEGLILLKDKDLKIQSAISYNNTKKLLEIDDTEIKIKETIFRAKGSLIFDTVPYIDMSIRTADSKVTTLLSLLPEKMSQNLSSYNSSGEVHFKASFLGHISTTSSPNIDVNFGLKNLMLVHPESKIKISNLNMNGLYTNKDNGIVSIDGFNCMVDQSPVHGDLLYKNFNDPYIKAHLATTQDLKSCLTLAGFKKFKVAKGNASIDFSIDGKLEDLKSKAIDKTHVEGSISAVVDELVFEDTKKIVNSHMKMRLVGQDLVLDTLNGNYENSQFNIKGAIKNFVLYIFGKNRQLDLEASLTSKNININDFYTPSVSANEAKAAEEKGLSLPNNMMVNFKCNIDNLKFNKLEFKNFKGKLKLEPHFAKLHDVSTQLAGGEIHLKGNISTKAPALPRIDATVELRKIHIDTVLHLFNNFDQKFITADNLKGQLTTKMYLNCSLDKKGAIDQNSIFSNIDVSIANGRLLNFEPMKKLAKFTDENELADIKFSELKNTFHIEAGVLYVPEMTIKSNLNTISIMGSHKFTNEMDYKLKINLKRKKKDSDEKFGAVSEDNSGNAQVFLTVKGTPDNLKIAYDKAAVKDKIKDRWKEEKQEMKSLFKKEPEKVEKKVQIDTEKELIDLD
jgi:AsmA-like C-terminal region